MQLFTYWLKGSVHTGTYWVLPYIVKLPAIHCSNVVVVLLLLLMFLVAICLCETRSPSVAEVSPVCGASCASGTLFLAGSGGLALKQGGFLTFPSSMNGRRFLIFSF